jgi:hypothetical protein
MTDQVETPTEAVAAASRSGAAQTVEAARLQTERAFILSMSRANRWMVGFSVGLAFVGLAGVAMMVVFLAKQLGVMSAQLDQMRTNTTQTQQALADVHRMGELIGQANDLARQANSTNQAILAADRRAWLAPKEADLVGTLEAGKPLAFTVSYGNTGKEPATNVAVSGVGALAPAPANGAWETFAVSQNQACQGIATIADGPVVYPSAIDAYSYRLTTSATLIDATVLSGAQVFYVQGCFAYDTAGDTHVSAYCFYLRPDTTTPPQNWTFRPCPGGAYAN